MFIKSKYIISILSLPFLLSLSCFLESPSSDNDSKKQTIKTYIPNHYYCKIEECNSSNDLIKCDNNKEPQSLICEFVPNVGCMWKVNYEKNNDE